MSTLKQTVVELMQASELTDPIDFADVPFDEEGLRELATNAVLARYEQMRGEGLSADAINMVFLVSTIHLALENLVLNLRLLSADGSLPNSDEFDISKLLMRFRFTG